MLGHGDPLVVVNPDPVTGLTAAAGPRDCAYRTASGSVQPILVDPPGAGRHKLPSDAAARDHVPQSGTSTNFYLFFILISLH
jgi:hypothetical protein